MFSIGLDCTVNVRKKIENISITFSIFLKKNIFTLHKPFNVSHHIPVKMISDQKGIFAVLKIELLIMDDNFKKNKNLSQGNSKKQYIINNSFTDKFRNNFLKHVLEKITIIDY